MEKRRKEQGETVTCSETALIEAFKTDTFNNISKPPQAISKSSERRQTFLIY